MLFERAIKLQKRSNICTASRGAEKWEVWRDHMNTHFVLSIYSCGILGEECESVYGEATV